MINGILTYLHKASEFSKPYAKRTLEYSRAAAEKIEKNIAKTQRKNKRILKIMKLKSIIEIIANFLLVIAAAMALALTIIDLIKGRNADRKDK